MEIESQAKDDGENDKTKTSRKLKRGLIILNCLLMAVGNVGGPLITRLYFQRGGRRQWLSGFLQTAGFPIIIIPLFFSYFRRRHQNPNTKPLLITPRLFVASAVIGLMTGVDDYLYAYGLSFIPVSTSALLIATQLAFTAFFAFLIVKQKFTPFSLNSIALLTVGAVLLGLHASSDRPKGVSNREYFLGFVLTLGAALLYGLVLPLVELTYRRAKQVITYTLVMEMWLVIGFFATLFCFLGMIVNRDFQVIPREANDFELGDATYYNVLFWSTIVWQCFNLGAIGIIYCVNTLLAGIIIAVFIPVVEVAGVVCFNEKFSGEKGMALALSLWGLASYSYGEYLEEKERKKAALLLDQAT